MASSAASAPSDNDADSARLELAACEKEISNVKALLRSINPAPNTADTASKNRLTVSWIKVEGLPEAAQPKLTLQLSSPIEEVNLTKLLDPLDTDEEEKSKSQHSFRAVETGQATLSVSAADADISLGSSTAYDLAPLLKFDAMKDVEEISKEIQVEIHPSSTEVNDDDGEEGTEAKSSEPVCTVTLRLSFAPSNKDRREELYEALNKITQRKAAAVEKLRQAAVSASRSNTTVVPINSKSRSSAMSKSPAVRAGFLNKTKDESKAKQLYNKYLGPQSFLRRNFPTARNYLVFVGIVTWMHFKGQLLALPPPV